MNGKAMTVARYALLNTRCRRGQVLFVGSSLMEQFPIEKLTQELELPFEVYNRGVSGYTIPELDATLETCVLDLAPRRVFINIGTNDLTVPGSTVEGVMEAYEALLRRIMRALPQAQILLMAYYPVNEEAAVGWAVEALRVRNNDKLRRANEAVARLAEKLGVRSIDVNDALKDEQGRLKAEYTVEGMHIREEGYRAIMPALLPYLREPLP